MSLIRSQACGGGRESPYDLERQVVVLEQSQRDLQDATDRVWELEDFIITQDEVRGWRTSVCDDRYHACTFAWDKLGALFTPH